MGDPFTIQRRVLMVVLLISATSLHARLIRELDTADKGEILSVIRRTFCDYRPNE